MALNFLLKRSGTASKRPNPASMALGELDLNYDASTGGIYYKDSAGNVVKVGPCQVSATAPNVSPAGTAGNSAGEFWFDTVNQVLQVWSGSAWVDATSTSDLLPLAGGTMTGDITFAGTQSFPVSGIQSASTTQPGVVQLNDTTSSTSTTEALTANQGKELQDQINALSIASNITLAGTIDATTGNLVTVTAEGTTAGFVIGDPLPAAASGNDNYFVIVTTPGTMTPPGGSAQECHQGDWWLSDGTAWVFLDVGFNATAATTSTPGVVQLATDAEVQAGLNTDHAVTSSGLQSKVSDSTSTTSSTALASSTAVKAAYDAGIQGQTDASAAQADASQALLDAAAAQADATQALSDAAAAQADATQALSDASTAQSTADAAVPDASYTALGAILSGTGAGTYATLSLGTNTQVLTVDTTCPGGIKWAAPASGLCGYTCVSSPFNTAVGGNAGDSITSGLNNTTVGHNAGTSITSGCFNNFIGSGAGDSVTTGNYNVAIGYLALAAATGAGNNIAIGYNSLTNSNANSNTAVGHNTLTSTSTGGNNTAIGFNSQIANTTGTRNITVGSFTAGTHSTACDITAIGYCVLQFSTAGCNTGVGSTALSAVTSGFDNVALGVLAGNTLTTGCQNVLIGPRVQPASITGSCQLAIGFSATCNWLTGDSTKAIRPGAGILDCAGSTGTAGQVLMSNGANAICWGTSSGGGGISGVTGTAPITVNVTDPANPVIGVSAGSTTASGVVQLNDTVTSTSTTEAATANAAKTAHDAGIQGQTDAAAAQATADAAMPTSGGTFTGSVTFAASSVGGTILTLDNLVPGSGYDFGSYNNEPLTGGTGTGATANISVGFSGGVTGVTLVNGGTGYTVGDTLSAFGPAFDPWSIQVASVTAGVIRTVTLNSETEVNGNLTFNTSPTFSPGVDIGAAEQVTYNNVVSGLTATDVQGAIDEVNTAVNAAVPDASYTALGDILVGTGAGTYTNVSIGTNGQVLFVNTACASDVCWGSLPTATPSVLGQVFGCTGVTNTALGSGALAAVPTGTNNVAIGLNAGTTLGTGSSNVFVGRSAGFCATSGSCNTVVGADAGGLLTTGTCNTFLGKSAGFNVTTGSNNVIVGNYTGTAGLTRQIILSDGLGTRRLQIGSLAEWLVNGSSGNAGDILTSGGSGAATAWCTPAFVGCGSYSAKGDILVASAASTPTALAVGANATVLTADSACANGVKWATVSAPSPSAATPSSPGVVAGFTPTNFTNTNVALGQLALSNTAGSGNTAIGFNTLGLTNATSCWNVGVGYEASTQVTSGQFNVSVGRLALGSLTTGSNNIAIGCASGVTTGGYTGIVNLTTESNRIVMGNFNHTCAQIKVAWTVTSDERDKAIDPAGVPYGLAFVNQIEPIAYCWCDRTTGEITEDRKRFGFSAQNISALETGTDEPVIISTDDPDHLMLTDQMLLPVLVNAIKELSAKNDELEARIRSLEIPG